MEQLRKKQIVTPYDFAGPALGLNAGGNATGAFQYPRSRIRPANTAMIDFGALGLSFDVSLKNIVAASRNLQSATIREIMGLPVPTGVWYHDRNFFNGRPADDGRGEDQMERHTV